MCTFCTNVPVDALVLEVTVWGVVQSSVGSLSNQDDGFKAVGDDLKDIFITLDSG